MERIRWKIVMDDAKANDCDEDGDDNSTDNDSADDDNDHEEDDPMEYT